MDQSSGDCKTSILDADIEEMVLGMLQQYADVLVDSRSVIDVQHSKNKERLATAEKHLADMERTMTLLQQDFRASYEAYKMDVPESAGLEMLDGRIQLTKLTKGIVDTFVEEIILFGEDRLEVRWKFQQCITK